MGGGPVAESLLDVGESFEVEGYFPMVASVYLLMDGDRLREAVAGGRSPAATWSAPPQAVSRFG